MAIGLFALFFVGIPTADATVNVLPPENTLPLSYPDDHGRILLPEEAQNGGSFPVYIFFHGKKTDGVGYIPKGIVSNLYKTGSIPPTIFVSPRHMDGQVRHQPAYNNLLAFDDGVSYSFSQLLNEVEQAIKAKGIQGVSIDRTRIVVAGHSNATHRRTAVHDIITNYGDDILGVGILDGGTTGNHADFLEDKTLPPFLIEVVTARTGGLSQWKKKMIPPADRETDWKGVPGCQTGNPFERCTKHKSEHIYLFEGDPDEPGAHENAVDYFVQQGLPLILNGGKTAGFSGSEQVFEDPFAPELGVQIPGFNPTSSHVVTKEFEDGKYVFIPFIGQYIGAIFNFGILLIGVLAVLMTIIAGAQWTLSRGNAAGIGQAKKRIGSAVSALIIAMGSYSLLYLVNPELTLIKPLRIKFVPRIDVTTVIFDGKDALSKQCKAKSKDDPTFNPLFKAFAKCNDVSWHFMKAVAAKESSFDHNCINTYGYVGLYQIAPEYCTSFLSAYAPWKSQCVETRERRHPPAQRKLESPTFNAAAFGGHLGHILTRIDTVCASQLATASVDSIPPRVHAMLAYLGHNTGINAMTDILSFVITNEEGYAKSHALYNNIDTNAPCMHEEVLRQGIYDYWYYRKLKRGASEESADAVASTRRKSITDVADFAQGYGMTSFIDETGVGTDDCPLDAKSGTFDFVPEKPAPGTSGGNIACTTNNTSTKGSGKKRKVLVIGDSMSAGNSYAVRVANACGFDITNKAAVGAMVSKLPVEERSGVPSLETQLTEALPTLVQYDDVIIFGMANEIGFSTDPTARIASKLKTMYDQVHATGGRVIAVTMTPWEGGTGRQHPWFPYIKGRLDRVNDWIRTGAAGSLTANDVIVDFARLGNTDNDTSLDAHFQTTRDTIHLSSNGQDLLAAELAKQAYNRSTPSS